MNERTIRLTGGEQVTVRPMTADDAAAVRTAFERLSPASLRARFFTPVPRLTPGVAADLTLVDDRRIVLLAVDAGGAVLGEARAVRRRDEPSTAEVAVTVDDDHQRRGLGWRLLRALQAEARGAGIERLAGHVLLDNVAGQALLARSGASRSIAEPGVMAFEIPLRARTTSPAVAARGALGLAS